LHHRLELSHSESLNIDTAGCSGSSNCLVAPQAPYSRSEIKFSKVPGRLKLESVFVFCSTPFLLLCFLLLSRGTLGFVSAWCL